MLRSHRFLILNWFRARELIAHGDIEGLNNKAKVTTKKAYGSQELHIIHLEIYPNRRPPTNSADEPIKQLKLLSNFSFNSSRAALYWWYPIILIR